MLELLAFLVELIFWVFFGPRHTPARTDMNILGDINPKLTSLPRNV